MHIVLVEDSAEDAELLALALEDVGLAVTWIRVDSRDSLLLALGGCEPALVLSDLDLPGFCGMEALALVRAQQPRCPFVFLTGNTDPEAEVAARQAGASGFYSKSRLDLLAATVAAGINAAPPPRPHPSPPTAYLRPRPGRA